MCVCVCQCVSVCVCVCVFAGEWRNESGTFNCVLMNRSEDQQETSRTQYLRSAHVCVCKDKVPLQKNTVAVP